MGSAHEGEWALESKNLSERGYSMIVRANDTYILRAGNNKVCDPEVHSEGREFGNVQVVSPMLFGLSLRPSIYGIHL